MFGAVQCGLDIDHASITSCSPPLPDIRCTVNGSTYFFELAEVVAQEQAQALATKGAYTSGFPRITPLRSVQTRPDVAFASHPH